MKKRKIINIGAVIMFITMSIFIVSGIVSHADTYDEHQVKNLCKEYDGYSTLKLSWEAKEGISRYIVYSMAEGEIKYSKIGIVEGTSYTIRDLKAGTYSLYTVRAYNDITQKEKYVYAHKINNAVDVLTKPDVVNDLMVSDVGSNNVVLSWPRVMDVSEYDVFKCNNASYEKIDTVKTNRINVKSLLGNKTYEFCVVAKIRKKGINEELVAKSDYSESVKVRTLPSEVTNVKQIMNNSEKNIAFKWETPKDIDEVRIYQYKNNSWQCIEKLHKTENSYNISALTGGTTLKIKIRTCVYEDGDIILDEGGVTKTFITAPSKVENLAVKDIYDNKATITWTKSKGATNYVIYDYDYDMKKYQVVKKLGDCSSYVYEGLSGLTKYSIKVVPQKEHPETKEMYQGLNVDAATSFVTKLSRVSDIEIASMSKKSVSVVWDDVRGASEYNVTLYDKNNNIIKKETVISNSYSYVADKDGVIDVILDVVAVANLDFDGKSIKEYSYNSTKKGISNIINPPKEVRLYDFGERYLSLTWDGLEGVTKYYIYYVTKDQNNNDIYNYVGETSYTDFKITNLDPGQRRTYVIKSESEDNGNKIESNYSKPYVFVTKIGAPIPNVESVYNTETKKNCLRVSWNAVESADKYVIYKGIKGKAYDSELVTLDKNTLYYDDFNVNKNKVYEYRIACVSVVGEKIYTGNKSEATTGIVGNYGIVVSSENGNVDWDKVVSSGINHAIICVTRYGEDGGENGTKLKKDRKFDENISGAINAGLKVGVYAQTYAETENEAIKEAELVLEYIKDYKLDYPVYYDMKNGTKSKKSLKDSNTLLMAAFCKKIAESGFKAGIYSTAKFVDKYLNASELKDYSILASSYSLTGKLKFPGKIKKINKIIDKGFYKNNKYNSFDIYEWEYSKKGVVPGIEGNVKLIYN